MGVGLHLLSLAYAGTVVRASLAGMTDNPASPPATEPRVRDLADIPAVEVITRAAVMLMSAAAEKLGLSDPDPAVAVHRIVDHRVKPGGDEKGFHLRRNARTAAYFPRRATPWVPSSSRSICSRRSRSSASRRWRASSASSYLRRSR